MSVFPGPSNAVVYAQFILQGRWRRMLLVAGGYGAMMGSIIYISTLGRSHISTQDMQGFVALLAGLQVFTLLVFGSFRVESAVRGDVTSRMLESHRLMPTPPLSGILGYLFGAPLQGTLVAVVNFALGALCCTIAGLSLGSWAFANAFLFFFAVFVHAIVLQLAFITRGGFLLLLISGLFIVSAAANGVLEMFPSLNILLFPMLSRASVFSQMFGGGPGWPPSAITLGYGGAVVGQAIITMLAIRVAIRRYLSANIVGISPIIGLILLATWMALAIAGFSLPARHYFGRGFDYDYEDRFAPKVVCSFASAMLLAIFPIAGAARSVYQAWRTAEPSSRRPATRFSALWTVLAASAILGGLLIGISFLHPLGSNGTALVALTALILLNFLVAMACVFAQGYLRGGRPWVIVLIWVPLTWIGPVIADQIGRSLSNSYESATWITALSAPGALALLWSKSGVAVQSGIIGQVLLTLLPAGLLLLARRKGGTP